MTAMTKLFSDLKIIQSRQATGKLSIECDGQTGKAWHVYFYMGRIVWAAGGNHRVRRWFRVLRQHCPERLSDRAFVPTRPTSSPPDPNEYWEVHILRQALDQNVITPAQTKAIVQSYVQEVFLGLIEQVTVKTTWTSLKTLPQQFVWLDADQVIQQSSELCKAWRQAVSTYHHYLPAGFSPDFALIIQHDAALQVRVSPVVYQVLTRLLNGQNTLWDLVTKMQKPLIPVLSSLLPLLRDDILSLKEIPDLVLSASSTPTPAVARDYTVKPTPATRCKGVIACIDDSPLIGQALTAILKPAGYDVISILDPLQGISVLLKYKPDLIFLDLVMPDTNGYELCSFLRKTAAFRDLPIVMLTGQNGVIDRLRAKVVGSTDFMNKPPEASKVLHVVQKYLHPEKRSQPSSDHHAVSQVALS
jgi:two-component system, chemotaxis family, response regulator PixG